MIEIMLNRLKKFWINFWGTKYYLINNNKYTTILVYKHQIYIIGEKEK